MAIGLYWAATRVPSFYDEPIDPATPEVRQASDEMLDHTTALANDVRREGQWSALFTGRQVNGWLSVDLVENHGQSLPPGISDVRTKIDTEGVRLACRYQVGAIATVLTLDLEPYLAAPNVVAVRIRGARAGLLPLPLGTVLDWFGQAAHEADLRLRWQRSDGFPLALIEIPAVDRDGLAIELEGLELRDDALYLAGRSRTSATSTAQRLIDQTISSENRQH